MAQLTLTERSLLANSPRFQQRLQAALKKKANFFLAAQPGGSGFPAIINDATAKQFYNLSTHKKKRHAKSLLSTGGNVGNPLIISEFFVSRYNEDIASQNVAQGHPGPAVAGNRKEIPGDPFDASANQLADFELTDSAASDETYNHFAGIDITDPTEEIDW